MLFVNPYESSFLGSFFLYNENPQFNWGFKKLKAMGRKK